MSLAALLVVVGLCADGVPGELCKYDDGVWFNPTPEQLVECAERADEIRAKGGEAICELVPAADGPDISYAAPTSLKF